MLYMEIFLCFCKKINTVSICPCGSSVHLKHMLMPAVNSLGAVQMYLGHLGQMLILDLNNLTGVSNSIVCHLFRGLLAHPKSLSVLSHSSNDFVSSTLIHT